MSKALVIITGASSGIGAAMAKIFSQAGYSLGLFARNLEALQQLNLPHTHYQSVDVTDYQAFRAATKSAEQKFGPVDCLINNAGYAKAGDFLEIDPVDHQEMVAVNIQGIINGVEAVLPRMREQKKGTIINISSIADRKGRPNLATYAATKAAVRSLSESLRIENAKFGIRVCNLAPAKILTPMLIAAHLNDNQVLPAEELAKTALWIYQQPQNICIRDLVFAPTHYEN